MIFKSYSKYAADCRLKIVLYCIGEAAYEVCWECFLKSTFSWRSYFFVIRTTYNISVSKACYTIYVFLDVVIFLCM